jgi:DNA-binding transcriptional MerR regulator
MQPPQRLAVVCSINPVATTGSRDCHEYRELARAADTNAETIRYYERIGLLPAPPRTTSNYRDYSTEHVSRLTFIRRSRDLGFPSTKSAPFLISPTRKTNLAKR